MSKRGLLTRLLEAVDRLLLFVKQQRRKAEIAALERELEPAMAQAFKTEGATFVNALGKLRDKPVTTWETADWLPLLDQVQEGTAPLFAEPWRATCGEAILRGVQLTADEVGVKLVAEADPLPDMLGISFDLRNPRAVRYLLEQGAELVANVDQTTKDIIRGILARGTAEGWSYDQMAEAIIAQYAEFAEGRPQEHIKSRAHLVAVTEVGQAYSHGNYCTGEELRDAGLTIEKAWDTMGDERICDDCQGNQEQGWIPFDDEFQSGHMRPLAHPACRCDILMRTVRRTK